MSVRVFAPAKINLNLHVGPARADGRHEVSSIVVFADVGDIVQASQADELSLDVSGPFAAGLAGEADNLVLRAARALAEAAGVPARARLALEKHLPIASGVGGGSADAAAALKALNRLWRVNATTSDLAAIARKLGSDVPACLAARALLMRGAGEDIEPIDLPALDAVLINPRLPLSTNAVFAEFDRMGLGAGFAPQDAPAWRDAHEARAGLGAMRNDLAASARALAPVLAEMESLLAGESRALLARLSGSGATMFALTENAEASATLAAALQARAPSWWVCATRLNAA